MGEAGQVVMVGRLGVEMVGTVEVASVKVLGVAGSVVEMLGKQLEMLGKQLEMLSKQQEMGKQQVGRAHPCQSSSNSRARTCGRQLWAMADGRTWTRRGRSRFSKRCATVSA
jgi:hypothetical protein